MLCCGTHPSPMSPIGKAGGIDGPSLFASEAQPEINILGVNIAIRPCQCYLTVLIFSAHACYMVWAAPSKSKHAKSGRAPASVALTRLQEAGGSDLLSPLAMAALRALAFTWCLGEHNFMPGWCEAMT